MNMFEATKVCLRKSFTIKGRANKSEFWLFYLFVISFIVLTGIFITIFADYEIKNLYQIFLVVNIFLLLIPLQTAKIRRLHDVNKSGWFALIGLIPFGELYVELILMTKPSVNINNLYDVTHQPASGSKSIDLKSSENTEIYSPNVGENGNKVCPFCAEIIKEKAVKCKHCHSVIEPIMVTDRFK